jgi:serine/threonine protein phosphatase PrpC
MLAHMVGVSTDPEVMRFELGPEHKFIVIASDGVWEFLSNEQIGKIVWPFFKNNSPEQAGNAIVRAAAEKWRQNDTVIDDITCVTIFLEVDCKIPKLNAATSHQIPIKKHQRSSMSQEQTSKLMYGDYQRVSEGVQVIEAGNTLPNS